MLLNKKIMPWGRWISLSFSIEKLFTQYEATSPRVQVIDLFFGKQFFQGWSAILHSIISFEFGNGYEPVALYDRSFEIKIFQLFSIDMGTRYKTMIAGGIVQPGLTHADGMICFYSKPVAMISCAPAHERCQRFCLYGRINKKFRQVFIQPIAAHTYRAVGIHIAPPVGRNFEHKKIFMQFIILLGERATNAFDVEMIFIMTLKPFGVGFCIENAHRVTDKKMSTMPPTYSFATDQVGDE
jgi:hypothetical protein